jgi:hypothetical protein
MEDHIARAYGISKDRYNELMDLCSNMMVEMDKEPLQTVSQHFDAIGRFCQTPAEWTVAVYMHTRWLCQTGRLR